MRYNLKTLLKANIIDDLDYHFSQFIVRKDERELTSEQLSNIEMTAALISRQIATGNICLESGNIPKIKEEFGIYSSSVPTWDEITDVCNAAKWCCSPGEDCPIVFDGKRLYLHRYFSFENDLASHIKKMSNDKSKFFPELKNRFTVITGGPGTGKTTRIAKIVSILWKKDPKLDIVLAAPTGKAASRMDEAVFRAVERLRNEIDEDISKKMTELKGSSIHRLLGWTSRPGVFRHNEENPLSTDVLIVDEASMVDLALMSRLVGALKKDASLILLGDKDQLTSVEAGNVLGDIYLAAKKGFIDPECVTELTESFRFNSDSGIGLLADSINKSCNAKELKEIFESNDDGSIELLSDGFSSEIREIAKRIERNYEALFRDNSFEEYFSILDSFKVLSSSRKGPGGIEEINKLAERIFKRKGLIPDYDPWYIGRPVMVLKNSYDLELFNGESGVVVEIDGVRRAVFRKGQNDFRTYPVSVLPEVETVYAMTVHKSQGSEYDEVMFIIPEREIAILSKELVYTAVTRARKKITIVSNAENLAKSLSKSAARSSGLSERLGE